MKNFIACCALFTAVSLGVVAVSGLASADSFSDYPISPLRFTSSNFVWSDYESVVDLDLSGLYPSSSEGRHTTMFASVESTANTSNPFLSPLTVQGNLSYNSYIADFSIDYSGPGVVSLIGTVSYNISMVQQRIRYSNTQVRRYWIRELNTDDLTVNNFFYPTSVTVFLDDYEVGSVAMNSSSNPSQGGDNTTNIDFSYPVTSSVSKLRLQFNFNYSVDRTFRYSYQQSYNESNYVTKLFDYPISTQSVQSFFQTVFSDTISISYTPYTTDQLIQNGFDQTHDDLTDINDTLKDIQGTIESGLANRPLTPMEQFESDYLENFEGQISQTESALSSSNSALPNGGDVGGFVSDVSEGLGLSGNSFSSSDFNAATGGFTGVDSIRVGGPWEFFTQGVADDLSGDGPSTIDDIDPIIAWMEQAERRRNSWFNPS